jgi:hypothetical protein
MGVYVNGGVMRPKHDHSHNRDILMLSFEGFGQESYFFQWELVFFFIPLAMLMGFLFAYGLYGRSVGVLEVDCPYMGIHVGFRTLFHIHYYIYVLQ